MPTVEELRCSLEPTDRRLLDRYLEGIADGYGCDAAFVSGTPEAYGTEIQRQRDRLRLAPIEEVLQELSPADRAVIARLIQEPTAPGHAPGWSLPMACFPRELVAEALDLVPRVNDDDPIAPALADWHQRAREAYQRATEHPDDDRHSERLMLHGTE